MRLRILVFVFNGLLSNGVQLNEVASPAASAQSHAATLARETVAVPRFITTIPPA